MTTTQEADDFFTASGNEAEAPKDQYGRYKLPDPVTGQPGAYTRATTISGTLEDKYHLSLWRQRMVAHGLAIRPDLYALAAATPLEDKENLNKLVDDACDAAGTSTGSNFGTALHGFTAVLDAGGDVSKIPEQFRDDVRAYYGVLAHEGIKPLPQYIERTCLNTEFGVAGTFDRIYQLPDGSLVIADLKTQKSMDFGAGSQGIQLALYSRARVLRNFDNHTYEPMPPVRQDLALIVHLPVGKATATLYWVNLNLGYHGAALAMQVREYRNLKNIVTPYVPGAPLPAIGSVPSMLETQIAGAPTGFDADHKTSLAAIAWTELPGDASVDQVMKAMDAHTETVTKNGAEAAAQQILADPGNSTPQAVAAAQRIARGADWEADVIERLATKQSKPWLQGEIRKLDQTVNVSRNRKPLAEILFKLRVERGLDGETGQPLGDGLNSQTHELPNVKDTISQLEQPTVGQQIKQVAAAAAQLVQPDSATATIAAAQAPWPPDPVPVNGRAAVLEGVPEKAIEAVAAPAHAIGDTVEVAGMAFTKVSDNPFEPAANPFDAPPPPPVDPAVEFANRMRAANSKQELAAIWNEAVAAGAHSPELQGIGGQRVAQLHAQGLA